MSKINKNSNIDEHALLLREVGKIAEALAETLDPLCEVVVHDLTNPDHAIVQIENNLSNRKVGDPATELGLARIADKDYPDKLVGYANTLQDGRPVKSTSIGLRNSKGAYVAARCLNLDVSYLSAASAYLGKLAALTQPDGPHENLAPAHQLTLEQRVQAFAQDKNKDPRALSSNEKRELLSALKTEGFLKMRGALEDAAQCLGTSRSALYYYLEG
ncbi:MAG: helix-turn-helix transcriptional regulator [Hyphomicrobiales bacterium]